MATDHPRLIAAFTAEVLVGPALCSQEHGGHYAMILRRLDKYLTKAQRVRWMTLSICTPVLRRKE